MKFVGLGCMTSMVGARCGFRNFSQEISPLFSEAIVRYEYFAVDLLTNSYQLSHNNTTNYSTLVLIRITIRNQDFFTECEFYHCWTGRL